MEASPHNTKMNTRLVKRVSSCEGTAIVDCLTDQILAKFLFKGDARDFALDQGWVLYEDGVCRWGEYPYNAEYQAYKAKHTP